MQLGQVSLLLLCLAPLSFCQPLCSQRSVDQCASSCDCKRIACCCGSGCGPNPQYNQCVNVSSTQDSWGCPCAASVATCTSNNNPSSSSTNPAIPFGATFPMIGTQALPDETWQKNIYMGTTMQFNPGAYFSYTNSYSVPNFNAATRVDQNGNVIAPTSGSGSAPTPAPDYTGTPCFSLSQPCPSGYYCKVNTGYNVQQKGACYPTPADYWNEGAGLFTDSQYYTGLAHPPLVLDPNHLGVVETPGQGYNSGYYGSYGSYSNGPGYSNPSGSPNSCASPSVCGYKAAYGTCWCDTKCASTNDCCPDITQFCGPSYGAPPAPNNYNQPQPGCMNDNGQCASKCGSPVPVVMGTTTCYCDSQCRVYGDCCCGAC